MPQMMPMYWLYMFIFTFILLMFLIMMMYYLFIPTLAPINFKLSMLSWFWKW